MKKSSQILIDSMLAGLLAGCTTTGLSVREKGAATYSDFVYALAHGQTNIPTAHKLQKPIALAVAQIGETAPPAEMLSKLKKQPALFSKVVALPMASSTDEYYRRQVQTNVLDLMVKRTEDMRNLARQLGASDILVFGGSVQSWEHHNALGALDFTIIGNFISPGVNINTEGKAAAALLDVETGTVQFLVNAEQTRTTATPSYFAQGKINSVQARVRDELIVKLTDEFVRKVEAE